MCAIGCARVACVMHGKKNSEHDKNRKIDGDEEREKKGKKRPKEGLKKKIFGEILLLARIDP